MTTPPVTGQEQQLSASEQMSILDLHLDVNNPRIQERGSSLDDEQILAILWREYSVDEVALSIAHNGFFQFEPLFVAEEDGKFIVVEGNRRLAAVRLLRDAELRNRLQATGLPEISKERAAELATLPVIRCQREEIWRYVGFKHVNGPQPWDSFAKAEYIAWVKNNLGTDLTEVAKTIGDVHLTVLRLYRAYMALKQAENSGTYDRNQRIHRHFSFSHLYTGLDYPGIRKFTKVADVQSAREKPIPAQGLKQFGELCIWLWGDKEQKKPALIKSQNPDLRRLDESLQSKDGITALRAGYGLTTAVDIARGDTAIFREALLKTKQSLQDARAKVVTGFNGEADLSREMGQILDLATVLDEDMRKIGKGRGRPARGTR